MKTSNTSLLVAGLALLPAGAVFGQSNAPNPGTRISGIPKLKRNAFVKGSVKLSPSQKASWERINLVQAPQRATGLWVLDTGWKPTLLDNLAAMTPAEAPGKPVTIGGNTYFPGLRPTLSGSQNVNYGAQYPVAFLLRADGLGDVNTKYKIQFSTSDHTSNLTLPYGGWSKPEGLIYSTTVTAPALHKSRDSKAGTFSSFISDPYMAKSISLSSNATWVYLSAPLPTNVTPQPGGMYFARVIPLSGRGTDSIPIGPASNWQPFTVKASKDDQAKQDAFFQGLADKAAAKKAAEASEAAAEASRKQKWADEDAEIAKIQSNISSAYQVRVVSYIPPKFADDTDAPLYFTANKNVNVKWDGGSANLAPGNTYYLVEVKNLLNSNRTWHQDLWDLVTAELNLISSIYSSAKSLAVDLMAQGISAVGINCDTMCREALSTGLDFALAWCGLPPTLPNIDQLYSQGLDYVAETAASAAVEEVTGVAVDGLGVDSDTANTLAVAAKPAARAGIRSLIDTIARPAPFDPAVPETWGTPSPFFRKHPAMLYLEIRLRPGATPPTKQTWQEMSIHFDEEFYSIPQLAMPRTVDHTLLIPVALSLKTDPSGWQMAGYMPDKNVDPEAFVGQPYYYSRGQEKIQISSLHKCTTQGGRPFYVQWANTPIDPGFVSAIPLPADVLTDQQQRDALKSNTFVQGPDYYTGKSPLIWFRD